MLSPKKKKYKVKGIPEKVDTPQSMDGKKSKIQKGYYDPQNEASYMLETPDVRVYDPSLWGKYGRMYDESHDKQAYIDRKKRQYLALHPILNRKAGLSMDYFPEKVEQNFAGNYDYDKNTQLVKDVAREEGWNPSKRESYVDDLTKQGERIVGNSKFGNKLQPSYWSRSLAGLQELGNFLIKTNLPGKQGDVLKYKIPGLTKKEQKEIADSNFGALETLAPMDIPGAAIANYIKNRGLSYGSDYKKLPGVLSGQKMSNVSDLEATLLNPFTYVGLEQLPGTAINIGRGAFNLGRAGVNTAGAAYDALKSNPQSWFQTPEQLLQNPELYKSLSGQTSWKDPLGKLNKFTHDAKIKGSYARENKMLDKFPGLENYPTRKAFQQKELEYRDALDKKFFSKSLERSRLPITPIMTEQGTALGGGQGRLFLNNLNPEEVVKLGSYAGSSEDLANLVRAGEDLQGMPLMENVAFPTNKSFTIEASSPRGSLNSGDSSHAVQFLPWKGNPLDPKNPVVSGYKGEFRLPSDKAKRELQYMTELLDKNKVGIDYQGQNNIIYDPITDSYKLVDLNYVNESKTPRGFNNLEKPVKQRIEDKFGYTIPEGDLPLELEFANAKSLKPLLANEITDNTGRFNKGVYTFKDYPQFIAKAEDPNIVAQMQGLDADAYLNSMVERTKNLDPTRFAKVLKTVPGKGDVRMVIMPKLRGDVGSKLSPEILNSIPDESYADFYNQLKVLRDEGLNYDFFGDNFMYDPYTEQFNLFDLSPQSSRTAEPGYGNPQFFESQVFGSGNPGIYGKVQAGENLKQALRKRLNRTYQETFPSDQEVYGVDEFNDRLDAIFKGLSAHKYGGINSKLFRFN